MVVVFPELSTEEDEEDEEEGHDEEGSNTSDEFTDSIEEDDDKVTARSLAAVQVGPEAIFSNFKLPASDLSPLDTIFYHVPSLM